jgi:hypothetical protein
VSCGVRIGLFEVGHIRAPKQIIVWLAMTIGIKHDLDCPT